MAGRYTTPVMGGSGRQLEEALSASMSSFEEVIHNNAIADFSPIQDYMGVPSQSSTKEHGNENDHRLHHDDDGRVDHLDGREVPIRNPVLWVKVLAILCCTLFLDVIILTINLYKKSEVVTRVPVVRNSGSQPNMDARQIPWKQLPPSNTRLSNLAFGSCSSQKLPMPYWDILAKYEPDLLILGGDNVHAECHDDNCTELRDAYQEFSRAPSFQGAKSRIATVATLDDHDYGQQDAFETNPHKDLARALFLDFFDIPKTDARWTQEGGVYTSYTWGPAGERIQVILLDTRYARSAFLPTDEPGAPAKEVYMPDYVHTDKHMLSKDQWDWLETLVDPIDDNDVQLRLLVSSVQVLAVGTGYECWQLLPHERDRLINLLKSDDTTATIIISGDRHMGGFYRDGNINEVTASSWTTTWYNEKCSVEQGGKSCDEDDEYRLNDLVRVNNFGTIEVDWEKRHVKVSLRRAESAPGSKSGSTSPGEELQVQVIPLKQE